MKDSSQTKKNISEDSILDWHNLKPLKRLLKNFTINSHNNKEFSVDNYDWIKNVTNAFGDNTNTIKNKLNLFFFNQFKYIKLYHATKTLNKDNFIQKGLKVLTPELIVELLLNANIQLTDADRKQISENLQKLINKTPRERRCHIYLGVDKYYDMLNEDGSKQKNCSFFDGSEALPLVLPENIAQAYKSKLNKEGKEIIVNTLIPLSDNYLEEDILEGIPLSFFALWFNNLVTGNNYFGNCGGLNIKINIPPDYILSIDCL